MERWLGFITFLCEVFGTMRSNSGEPFRVLVCPIYTCLREVCTLIHFNSTQMLASTCMNLGAAFSFLFLPKSRLQTPH